MTVGSLNNLIRNHVENNEPFSEQDVAQLKRAAEDLWHVSDGEATRLLRLVEQHPDLFCKEDAADLRQFATRHLMTKSSWVERALEVPLAVVSFAGVGVEAVRGLVGLARSGTAPADEAAKIRRTGGAAGNTSTVGLVKLDPKAELPAIERAIRDSITAIDGFSFLSSPPEGQEQNAHTVLIKPGVNWGINGYPTVSSWESIYTTTKMAFEEGDARGAEVDIIVGEQSGVEVKLWGGTTMDNLEKTGILHGAVLAGLERAAQREAAGGSEFAGAAALLADARALEKITRKNPEMIAMAERAGVRVIGFDELEHTRIEVPNARHFKDGILVPKIVAEEVTDIINIPKPPGRHVIMGNTGVTGAVKNHIGLLGASDRIPALHGPFDRFPAMNDGENGDSFVDRLRSYGDRIAKGDIRKVAHELAGSTKFNWDGQGPGEAFQEKIVELYAAFADKERFTVTDMRKTVSTLGPDIGDTIDIGVVIAAKDPVSVDIYAGALLKRAYDDIGDFGDAAKPGGDSIAEYLIGKTWLREAGTTPFDQWATLAANSYGFGPVSFEQIDVPNIDSSGFSAAEIAAINGYLGGS